jgi:hypothetical protein
MARTARGAQLTKAHTAAQLAARAGSLSELVRLWRVVDPTNLAGTVDTFARAAAILAGQGSDRSGVLASRYYSLFRSVEIGAPAAAVRPAARIGIDVMASEIRGATLSGIIAARRGGLTVPAAAERGFVRVMGTVGKLILNGGRRTIIGAAETDRRALGFARVTSGDPCAFCRTLAGRGPVYKTEKSADFEAHGSCACSAEPVYPGFGPSGDAAKYRAEYAAAQRAAREDGTSSTGTSNNSLNNYRRYLAGGATAGTPSEESG